MQKPRQDDVAAVVVWRLGHNRTAGPRPTVLRGWSGSLRRAWSAGGTPASGLPKHNRRAEVSVRPRRTGPAPVWRTRSVARRRWYKPPRSGRHTLQCPAAPASATSRESMHGRHPQRTPPPQQHTLHTLPVTQKRWIDWVAVGAERPCAGTPRRPKTRRPPHNAVAGPQRRPRQTAQARPPARQAGAKNQLAGGATARLLLRLLLLLLLLLLRRRQRRRRLLAPGPVAAAPAPGSSRASASTWRADAAR